MGRRPLHHTGDFIDKLPEYTLDPEEPLKMQMQELRRTLPTHVKNNHSINKQQLRD